MLDVHRGLIWGAHPGRGYHRARSSHSESRAVVSRRTVLTRVRVVRLRLAHSHGSHVKRGLLRQLGVCRGGWLHPIGGEGAADRCRTSMASLCRIAAAAVALVHARPYHTLLVRTRGGKPAFLRGGRCSRADGAPGGMSDVLGCSLVPQVGIFGQGAPCRVLPACRPGMDTGVT